MDSYTDPPTWGCSVETFEPNLKEKTSDDEWQSLYNDIELQAAEMRKANIQDVIDKMEEECLMYNDEVFGRDQN